jgi:TRAP-type transport system periplasmic protein
MWAIVKMGLALSAAAAMACTPAGAQDKPIELKLSHWLPLGHVNHQHVLAPWAEMIEKRSQGKLKITIFPGSVLGKPADHWDMAQNGIVDIAWGTHNYTAGRFPLTAGFDLPFMTKTAKGASRALWEYYVKHLQKEHARVKVLWLQAPPPFHLHMVNKAVLKPEEFVGLRIRVGGGPVSDLVKVLGGVPVALSVPEGYNALERGIVDGTILPHEALYAFKLAEVTKHHVEVRMYTTSQFLVMNLAKYNSLPAELKKVLDELGGAWGAEFAGAAWDKGEQPGIDAANKAGNRIYKLTDEQLAPWKEKAKQVADDWIKATEAKGLPARQALEDLRALIRQYDP